MIIGIDRQAERNLQLTEEIKNVFSDKDMINFKMEESQKQAEYENSNIKKILENKDNVKI